MRTIVFSDVHGEPSLIDAVLEHSRFDAHSDRLVFAGDAVDLGRDSLGCLLRLEAVGAEFLVGNHEYAAHVDFFIDDVPLDAASRHSIAENISSGRWVLAAESEGVLITHAGVSAEFPDGAEGDGVRNAAACAELLNAQFRGAVAAGDVAWPAVVEMGGLLWWRPGRSELPMRGLRQVVGHTPREIAGGLGTVARLATSGVHLIDPNVRAWRSRRFSLPAPVRYAIIEDGDIRVIDA